MNPFSAGSVAILSALTAVLFGALDQAAGAERLLSAGLPACLAQDSQLFPREPYE